MVGLASVAAHGGFWRIFAGPGPGMVRRKNFSRGPIHALATVYYAGTI